MPPGADMRRLAPIVADRVRELLVRDRVVLPAVDLERLVRGGRRRRDRAGAARAADARPDGDGGDRQRARVGLHRARREARARARSVPRRRAPAPGHRARRRRRRPAGGRRQPDGGRPPARREPRERGPRRRWRSTGRCSPSAGFRSDPLDVADLVGLGTLTPAQVDLLGTAVTGRVNIAVSGGTGTGKTTLLNALAGFIDPAERIVTVEDAAELRLPQHHVARLESRPPNVEGRGEVTLRALVRNALRMRPDRIVVGEVRGGEALDMLQAMNTGHDGSLTTVHASSTADALRRHRDDGADGRPRAAALGRAGAGARGDRRRRPSRPHGRGRARRPVGSTAVIGRARLRPLDDELLRRLVEARCAVPFESDSSDPRVAGHSARCAPAASANCRSSSRCWLHMSAPAGRCGRRSPTRPRMPRSERASAARRGGCDRARCAAAEALRRTGRRPRHDAPRGGGRDADAHRRRPRVAPRSHGGGAARAGGAAPGSRGRDGAGPCDRAHGVAHAGVRARRAMAARPAGLRPRAWGARWGGLRSLCRHCSPGSATC